MTSKTAKKPAAKKPYKPRRSVKALLQRVAFLETQCRKFQSASISATAERERAATETTKFRSNMLDKNRGLEKERDTALAELRQLKADYKGLGQEHSDLHDYKSGEEKRLTEALRDIREIITRTVRVVLREHPNQEKLR